MSRQPHEDYMKLAENVSKSSQDPNTKVGAVIINKDGAIVGKGCNNFPNGCDNKFTWNRERSEDNKHFYVVHAEANAILNSCGDAHGCDIYVTLFPCNECTKLIIQSKIENVFYANDKDAAKPNTLASKKMLDTVGIKYVQIN